ncbi:MAG: DNA (cytosine-5-)-methyltransferase [Candidatus Kaiserbacteria bacterium]|nr:DNA (cytosine-5-)-methyltransferase [Candidatus Kaiserbacteria bacterium]
MNQKKLKAIDLFAGIGGIRIGFESAGFETIYSNDFDKNAAATYRLNYGEIDDTSLIKVTAERGMKKIPKKFDILLGGFPCQPFSVAGNKKGFADANRGNLLFNVIEILKKRKPRAVFLENVKHLKNHDDEKTFKRIQEELLKAGYHMKAEVMNSMTHGNVPQNRERIYIVAFRSPRTLMKFRFPDKIPLTKKMSHILEKNVDDEHYYDERFGEIYTRIKKAVKNRDSFYQYRRIYVRELKNGMAPTLTASMGAGGHNVPLIRDAKGVRRLTPRECARLQGFPESFKFPTNQAKSHLYKQVGNSVTVPVISRIAENIRIALES